MQSIPLGTPSTRLLDSDALLQRGATLTDSRHAQGLRYPLAPVLLLLVLAKLCGQASPAGSPTGSGAGASSCGNSCTGDGAGCPIITPAGRCSRASPACGTGPHRGCGPAKSAGGGPQRPDCH